MTATDIYEHPEYYNTKFQFPNEQWRPLHRKRFNRYKQSNCFRIKNEDLDIIMKPCDYIWSNKMTFKLRDDEGKVHTISTKELFDGFDVDTQHKANKGSEFIWGAF